MKKVVLTIAIVLGLGMASFAQGLFNRGYGEDGAKEGLNLPTLPAHNQTSNQNAPLGGGALLLIGLGAAYAMTKKSKK